MTKREAPTEWKIPEPKMRVRRVEEQSLHTLGVIKPGEVVACETSNIAELYKVMQHATVLGGSNTQIPRVHRFMPEDVAFCFQTGPKIEINNRTQEFPPCVHGNNCVTMKNLLTEAGRKTSLGMPLIATVFPAEQGAIAAGSILVADKYAEYSTRPCLLCLISMRMKAICTRMCNGHKDKDPLPCEMNFYGFDDDFLLHGADFERLGVSYPLFVPRYPMLHIITDKNDQKRLDISLFRKAGTTTSPSSPQ